MYVAAVLAKQGSLWKLAAPAAHFRNGVSERMIQMARHSLSHLLETTDPMDYHHFSTLLTTISATLNSRPLGLSRALAGELTPITPGDLLTGKTGHSHSQVEAGVNILNDDETVEFVEKMMRGKMAIFQAWKESWAAKIFPTLVARAKWKNLHPNVKTDTVGLLQYQTKFGPDTWKLARAVSLFPDPSGAVRTIEVQLGVKKGQHGGVDHRLVVPVQRFCPLFHPDD